MTTYREYTTVQAVRGEDLDDSNTSMDSNLLDLIRSVSAEIDGIAGWSFVPTIQARVYDTPNVSTLRLDAPLLEVVSLSNGDESAISSGSYLLGPGNDYPKRWLELKAASGVSWQTNASGEVRQVVSLTGVWGYHSDYGSAWQDTGLTLSGSAGSAATALDLTGEVDAGELLKVGSEYIYVAGGGSAPEVARGANGSTSGSHAAAAPVYRWFTPDVEQLARSAVVARWRLRQNPTGESIQVGGDTFITPKDVTAWLRKQIGMLGYRRVL